MSIPFEEQDEPDPTDEEREEDQAAGLMGQATGEEQDEVPEADAAGEPSRSQGVPVSAEFPLSTVPPRTALPLPPISAPVRPPRPPAVAQRNTDSSGWHTANLTLCLLPGGGEAYLEIRQSGREQSIFVNAAVLRRLIALVQSPQLEPGELWRKLSEIPLERPLPSRALDEELRAILQAHIGGALRRS